MTTLIVKSIKSLKNCHLYLYRRSPIASMTNPGQEQSCDCLEVTHPPSWRRTRRALSRSLQQPESSNIPGWWGEDALRPPMWWWTTSAEQPSQRRWTGRSSPWPATAESRRRPHSRETVEAYIKAEPAFPDLNDDFMDGNDSDHSAVRATLQEAPRVRLRDPVLQARQDRDYQETFLPTLGARPRDRQSQPVTQDEKLVQLSQYRVTWRPLARRPRRSPFPKRSSSSDVMRAERVINYQRKKGKKVKEVKSEPE